MWRLFTFNVWRYVTAGLSAAAAAKSRAPATLNENFHDYGVAASEGVAALRRRGGGERPLLSSIHLVLWSIHLVLWSIHLVL